MVQALHRLRSAQGILSLADRHGADRLDGACALALAAGDPSSAPSAGSWPSAPTRSRPAPAGAASVATPAHLHGRAGLLAHLHPTDDDGPGDEPAGTAEAVTATGGPEGTATGDSVRTVAR